ncbi:MAG: transposase [Bacteroidota bacterium]|nr:transposase [Bacteroidota bacterium]
MKMIIMGSFQWLVQHELVHIYGYVIMDNHIHVLWEQLKMNGKEMPKESFEKFTGHMFLKQLKKAAGKLSDYKTEQKDRNFIFWQRDPLAILITSRKMAGEKPDYMPVRMSRPGGHYNPLQPHWQLVKDPTEYRFSSARFYETGEDEFKILTHYMDKL